MFNSRHSKGPSPQERLRKLTKENAKYKQALERMKTHLNLAENSVEILRNEKNRRNQEIKELKQQINKIAQGLVPGEYAQKRVNNEQEVKKWGIEEIINFVIDTVRERERQHYQDFKKVQEDLTTMKMENSRLQQTISDLRGMQTSSPKQNNVEHVSNQPLSTNSSNEGQENRSQENNNEPMNNNGSPQNMSEQQQGANIINHEESEKNVQNNQVSEEEIFMTDEGLVVPGIDNTMKKLNDEHLILLQVIGKTGIYRTRELKEENRILEAFNTDSLLNNRLNELKQADVLDEKSCSIGVRGHFYKTFALTPKGKVAYRRMFGSEPKESMREWLINQHSTIEHGVLIHDTALVFEEHGYESFLAREDNTVEVTSDAGQRIVFDLTVKKAGIIKRVECERGNHNEKIFKEKLDKFYEVSECFHFVTPNKQSREKVKGQFFNWVGSRGGKNKVNVKVKLITLEDLKKGEDDWEEYDLTS
ncbi:MAG: hypothetical protein ACOCQR_03780 [bacterium]